jgi:hypothetical protein
MDGPLVGQAKQLDGSLDIRRRLDPEGDPPRVGQHMMGERTTGSDQLVSHASGERKVGDPVAVQMADLPPAHPELDAAEPMETDLDVRPRCNGRDDLLGAGRLLGDDVRYISHRSPG